MIVHKTETHHVTVEFLLLQVQLWPSTVNQSPYHNGSCKSQITVEASNHYCVLIRYSQLHNIMYNYHDHLVGVFLIFLFILFYFVYQTNEFIISLF